MGKIEEWKMEVKRLRCVGLVLSGSQVSGHKGKRSSCSVSWRTHPAWMERVPPRNARMFTMRREEETARRALNASNLDELRYKRVENCFSKCDYTSFVSLTGTNCWKNE